MVRKISHAKVLRRGYLELTSPGMSLLAFVSSLALAPACTFVVGEPPTRAEDTGADAPLEHDAATEQEAGIDAAMAEDGGAALDATSPNDAGAADAADAAPVDATAETGATSMEAGGADSAIVDAGPAPDCGSSAGMLWYPDEDNDGYGRSAEAVQTCGKPTTGDWDWVRRGGDCKDNDGNVHPEQTSYYGMPYRGADGNDSFDYDCSETEEANPNQRKLASCGLLELIACSGSGYMPSARTGANADAFCGSRNIGTCMAGALGLGCSAVPTSTDAEPFKCK
jgi:hypothetical protein